jgi:hypothetical protein
LIPLFWLTLSGCPKFNASNKSKEASGLPAATCQTFDIPTAMAAKGWLLSYGFATCPLQTGRSAKTRTAEQIANTYVKFADRREPCPVFGLLHCLSGMMTGFMMLSLIPTSAYQVRSLLWVDH